MPAQLSFDPARSAVLSMDSQTAIVSIYAQDQAGLLGRAASGLRRARSLGMCIIPVQVGFRQNLLKVSPRNVLLSAIKSSVKHRQPFEGTASATSKICISDNICAEKERYS